MLRGYAGKVGMSGVAVVQDWMGHNGTIIQL